MASVYANKLIFGKSQIDRVVNVEFADGVVTLFRQQPDGSVVEDFIDSKYWFLTQNKLSSRQIKLEGAQHYQWLAEFDTHLEYMNARKTCQWKKKDFWCAWDDVESVLIREGITYYKGLKHNEVSILSFDIETSGLVRDRYSKVYIISNTFRDTKGKLTKKLFALDDFDDDMEFMINSWCSWVRLMNPSIMVGHNIFGFDFPYLKHVAELYGTALILGRDDSEAFFNPRPSFFRKDQSQKYEYNNVKVYGREVIDGFFLAIKYDAPTKKYESYGLKQIIKQEGLEKQGRTYIDASKIRQYYEERNTNPKLWLDTKTYASEDSDDSLKLYDLMGPSFFYFSQSIPKSFQQINNSATGAQINAYLVRAYFQDGYSIPKANEMEHYGGGISFGVPGIYNNAFKCDISSLYPSIIDQWEIYDKEKDPKAYFLQTVRYFRAERLKNKELGKTSIYHKDLSESGKIFVNSAYGALGTQGLNFNSLKNADFVTNKGRNILSDAIKFSTGFDIDYWRAKADMTEEPQVNEAV